MAQEQGAGSQPPGGRGLAILVLGNDTFIEALPATPIQLIGASLAIGFDVVVPGSWGDELVAELATSKLERRGGEPAVFCACPRVCQRLRGRVPELEPALLVLPAPPLALAKYLRETYSTRLAGLAFVGRCPSARAPHYDTWFEPSRFLELLRKNGLDPASQPGYLDGILPPDMRRFRSLPGGLPARNALETLRIPYSIAVTEGRDLLAEVAQELLSGESVLIDPSPALGCSCAGAMQHTLPLAARPAVTSLEPPRATAPVVAMPASWRQDSDFMIASFNSDSGASVRRRPIVRPAITPSQTVADAGTAAV